MLSILRTPSFTTQVPSRSISGIALRFIFNFSFYIAIGLGSEATAGPVAPQAGIAHESSGELSVAAPLSAQLVSLPLEDHLAPNPNASTLSYDLPISSIVEQGESLEHVLRSMASSPGKHVSAPGPRLGR